MTNQEFVYAVREKLLSSGLPEEFVDDQCNKLLTKINDLPEESAQKYTQEQNVDTFAEKIAIKYRSTSNEDKEKSHNADEEAAAESETDSTRTVEMPKRSKNASSSDSKNKAGNESKATEIPNTEVKTAPIVTNTSEMVVVFDTNTTKKKSRSSLTLSFGDGITSDNPRPVLLFTCLLIMLAPVGIVLFGAYFTVFLSVFVALAAAIIVMIAAIIGIVALGSLISVASLLYGATQIISEPRFVGIHEIGFGLLVAGITILLSVILYNIAIRLVPFIYAKLITFIGFSARKLKEIFVKAKKGCENL